MSEQFDLFPAVDLRRGRVVRLAEGDDQRSTEYDVDPVARLGSLASAGARWVHVVDLDAAFGEEPQSGLLELLAALPGRPKLQLGGGLRDESAVRSALGLGFERLVLGSFVTRQPQRFRLLAATFPDRLVPALDAAEGRVRISGWRVDGGEVEAVAAALAGLPCPAVLVTDVGRDGLLTGPNLDLATDVAKASGLPVLVSGGVGSLADIAAARCLPGAIGVIVGRALYEGRFSLEEALAVATGDES